MPHNGSVRKYKSPYKYYRRRIKPPKGTPCGYCFSNYATGYDHIIPVSYNEDNSHDNLYPACIRCNRLLSNLMFDTLEEKRQYIRNKLIELGEWNVKIDNTIRITIPFEKQGLQKTSRPVKPELEVICKSCGQLFITKRLNAVYCRPTCLKTEAKKLREKNQNEKALAASIEKLNTANAQIKLQEALLKLKIALAVAKGS